MNNITTSELLMLKIFFILLAIFLPFQTFAANSDYALVLAVHPGVDSIYQGRTEALAVKMDIPIKADIRSDNSGRAELIFADDSTLSIAPDTEISLAEYVDTPNQESVVFNMASGTARVITGELSRRNPTAFTVNTPQASIAIRGTMVTIQVRGDETRVYLNETSGLGVTVRALQSGQTLSMRKPGTMIRISPQGVTERRAEKGEARQINAQLRGKFQPAAVTAQSKRNESPAKQVATAPSGNLPFTTSLNISQMDEMNHTAKMDEATLVADNSTPSAPIVPIVPDKPNTPEVPEVPPSNPVTPEPPVGNYMYSPANLAGTYVAEGDFYFETPTANDVFKSQLSLTIPSTYSSVNSDTMGTYWNVNFQNVTVPELYNGSPTTTNLGNLPGSITEWSDQEFSLLGEKAVADIANKQNDMELKVQFHSQSEVYLNYHAKNGGTTGSGEQVEIMSMGSPGMPMVKQ